MVEYRLPVTASALHDGVRTSLGDEPCGKPFEFADDGAELLDLRVGFVLGSAGHDTDQDELLADVDAGTSFNNRFNHPLLQCGQAAGGDVGILFYGLERHQSGVHMPPAGQIIIRGRTTNKSATLLPVRFSSFPVRRRLVKEHLLIHRCGRCAAMWDYHA